MADKIECVDTIEKFFHLVNDEVEKHGYSVDEVLWIWASGQVAFEGDSKVTMRALKEEVRRAASTNKPCTQWPSFEEWLAHVRDSADGKLLVTENMQNVLRICHRASELLYRRLVHSAQG